MCFGKKKKDLLSFWEKKFLILDKKEFSWYNKQLIPREGMCSVCIAYFANSGETTQEKLASCLEKQLLLSHKFYSQGITNKLCLNFLTSHCTQKGRGFLRNVQCRTQNFSAFCRLRPCKWLLGSSLKIAHSSCVLASPLPGLSGHTKPKTRSI